MKTENRKRRFVMVRGYRRRDPNVRVSVLVQIEGSHATKAFELAEQIGGDRYFWCRIDTRPLVNRELNVVYRRRRK
jgi:hypothetical protein